MKKVKTLRWFPLVTFLLITPCGSDTFCIPMLISIPLVFVVKDLSSPDAMFSTFFPLLGIVLSIYANTFQPARRKIPFIIGTLLLISCAIKFIYDSGSSFNYVWNSPLTYFTLAIFFICSIAAIYQSFSADTTVKNYTNSTKDQKLYPDVRPGKWANLCQRTAYTGFIYSLLVTIGFHLVDEQAQLVFSILYIVPAICLLIPLELIVLLITIQSWNRWGSTTQRMITLLGSGGAVLLLGGQTIFNFGFS